jgi:hypothetical protein
MKSYLHISAPALLLIVLAGAGCAVKIVTVGIAPDKVDQIEIGTDRATVEDLVDGVESELSCTSGARVDYVYDRGLKPHDNPALGAAAVLAANALFFGYAELTVGVCWAACQQGLLEIIYDSDGKVVAATPNPRGYYAGIFCDEGGKKYYCDDVRAKARETDLARRLMGDEQEVRVTGCFEEAELHNRVTDPRLSSARLGGSGETKELTPKEVEMTERERRQELSLPIDCPGAKAGKILPQWYIYRTVKVAVPDPVHSYYWARVIKENPLGGSYTIAVAEFERSVTADIITAGEEYYRTHPLKSLDCAPVVAMLDEARQAALE